ncbi:MAG: M67 family metallopeptidase [Acidimicrobiia bacterium]|nr:M67 family metallopeptidase [Acidimicrobiia bacterium]
MSSGTSASPPGGRSGGVGLPAGLPDDVGAAIIQHTRYCAPDEACGLLGVDGDGSVVIAYCLPNVHSQRRRRFTVDPAGHYRAMRHAEAHGWSIGGSFHSHPGGPAIPSPTDIAGAFDPTWWYVIAGPLPRPEVRVYRIVAGVVTEVPTGVIAAARRPGAVMAGSTP